jgi:hypothetical protein
MTPRTPGQGIAKGWLGKAAADVALEVLMVRLTALCAPGAIPCLISMGQSPCGDCVLCRLVQRVRCEAWRDFEGEFARGMERAAEIDGPNLEFADPEAQCAVEQLRAAIRAEAEKARKG